MLATDRYFAGRKLQYEDRLGSKDPGPGYYPYGEQIAATANPADKFATYHRDATGLDYADQRYYHSASGRFVSSDPYQASAGTTEPTSWNRTAYVGNDPVNFRDSRGLMECPADTATSVTVCEEEEKTPADDKKDRPDKITTPPTVIVSAETVGREQTTRMTRDIAKRALESLKDRCKDDLSNSLQPLLGGAAGAPNTVFGALSAGSRVPQRVFTRVKLS